jgi:uncharacterized phiE125 gp8 family phage protein
MLYSPSILSRGTTAISLADAKVMLEVSSGTHPHDDMITGIIAAAQAYVEERTGRFLQEATGVIYLSTFQRKIEIPRCKIASITVSYFDADNVSQTIDAANFVLIRYSTFSKLYFLTTFDEPAISDRPDAMTINITFAADVVYPKLMLQAMSLIIADYYENRENGIVRDIYGSTTGMNNRVDHLLQVARIWGH